MLTNQRSSNLIMHAIRLELVLALERFLVIRSFLVLRRRWFYSVSRSFWSDHKVLQAIMEDFFDEYEYYNFDKSIQNGNTRKGRTKREASLNTNRFNPGGNERKIVVKFRNTEKNRRPKTSKKWNSTKHVLSIEPTKLRPQNIFMDLRLKDYE